GDASAAFDLVIAAAAAKIARPAAAARLLPIHMALRKMNGPPHHVAARTHVAHRETLVVDQPMARIQSAVRLDAQVAGAGAARIGPMTAAMDFVQRRLEVA